MGVLRINCISFIMFIYCFAKLESRTVTPSTLDTDTEFPRKVIHHWPDGVIPYDLTHAMYEKNEKGLILAAMKRWEYKTCIKFVPWTEHLRKELGRERYLRFFSAGSCFSRTGMQDEQPQLFGIGKTCMKLPTVLHELGHTLGLVHQMERSDRDFYIDINAENMHDDSRKNFDTTDAQNVHYKLYNTPYDYKSIMHYEPKAWSKNKKAVIVSRDPAYQHVIGKVDDVSFFDALYVNRAYRCSERCSDALSGICQNGGFLGGPDCRCICQDGYAGQFCETALPGFEHIIEWRCQKGWVFNSGKCYLFNTDGMTNFQRAKTACVRNNATLLMLKERPELEWVNHMVEEHRLITETTAFWIGMKREWRNDLPTNRWIDGSLVDNNLVSMVDNRASDLPGCAVFDGETVTFDNCTTDQKRGYICEKDFDSTCGGRYVVSDASSVNIQSPGFPNGYPEAITCTYVLQTSEESRLEINFHTFELDRFNKDYVDILLEDDVTLPGDRYDGDSLSGTSLETKGNLAILTFKANGRISGRGFQATVEKISSSALTTASSLPVLDSLRKAFSTQRETTTPTYQPQMLWSLSELFNIIKSMAFAKLL